MPSPSPIRRQFARSAVDPAASRGYQASGTQSLRPSIRSSVTVSSVIVTVFA